MMRSAPGSAGTTTTNTEGFVSRGFALSAPARMLYENCARSCGRATRRRVKAGNAAAQYRALYAGPTSSSSAWGPSSLPNALPRESLDDPLAYRHVPHIRLKGRGVHVTDPTDLKAVTPDAHSKIHFVIVDCVGISEISLAATQSLPAARWQEGT